MIEPRHIDESLTEWTMRYLDAREREQRQCKLCHRVIVIERCTHVADVTAHPENYCPECWQETLTLAARITRDAQDAAGYEPESEHMRRSR